MRNKKAVFDIFTRSGVEEWCYPTRHYIKDHDCREIFSTFKGKIVGYCVVDTESKMIYSVCVDPEYRGKGIGKKVVKMAIKHGGRYLECEAKLIKFYNSLGFVLSNHQEKKYDFKMEYHES